MLSIDREGQESLNNVYENLKFPGAYGIIFKFSQLYWEAIEKFFFMLYMKSFIILNWTILNNGMIALLHRGGDRDNICSYITEYLL